eukprot:TRINITY_DN15880_c0_g1_i3.p1 TRINITY_DN15880_c0_g1~~TRINITY_DN15880_c0_g1_i3.p1  ORF type:complete len:439 (-),score=92.95 TRINITY_DN15880_c0_g1_i3:323-1558(-)
MAEASYPAGGADDANAGLMQLIADGSLAKTYRDEVNAAARKVSHQVERCLLEATEAKRGTFFIEAPGNHKTAFTSRLEDEDMQIFVKAFAMPLPALVRLDLSYNLITDIGAASLAAGLLGQRATCLSALSLRSNSIGPDGCEAICSALRLTPSLRRLDMSQNQLGRKGGLVLVSLLRDSPELLELLMGDIEADIDVLVSLAATLLQYPSQLKVCDIQNPRISTLQEDHTVHLGRMLRVNTTITELYIGKLRIRDDGIRQLVDFLLENKALRVLDLRCNDLGADGAAHIAKLLVHDCRLLTLNLAGNRIGEKCNLEGARELSEAISYNTTLRHLDLNHNQLCGPALQLLGEKVEKSTTLESLELFHSQWDQPSSYTFHTILNDRGRKLPLKTDFVTSEVGLRIEVCQAALVR